MQLAATAAVAKVPAAKRLGEKGPSLLAQMREDARAALARDPAAESLSDIVIFSTGTHIVWSYRANHWLWQHGMHKLALLLAKRTRRRLSADIHPAATIGRRLTIDHGVGVVIGDTAVIGDDCLLYQGVTLGMTGKHGGKRHPTLGSGVMVGANATVLGNIRVGDGVRVGAGAVVLEDVPNDVTVAGVPARIVRDRRYHGPHLVADGPQRPGPGYGLVAFDGASQDLAEENLRWSCAL